MNEAHDHDKRAALYTLAVAVALLGKTARSYATTCIGTATGKQAGVYHLLTPFHSDWERMSRKPAKL